MIVLLNLPMTSTTFSLNKIAKIGVKFQDRQETLPTLENKQVISSVIIESFVLLTAEHILKDVKCSPSKTRELGPIPARLTKWHLDTVAPSTTGLVNTSLQQGSISNKLKTAIVHPLPKKFNLTSHPTKLPSNVKFVIYFNTNGMLCCGVVHPSCFLD